MTSAIQFQELPQAKQDEATHVISDALMIEPGYIHIFPDAAQRRLVLQSHMGANIDTAFRRGKVWAASEGDRILAVAIWLAPGEYPLDNQEKQLVAHYSAGLESLEREKMEQLDEYDLNCVRYFPKDPCWYLQAYGVDPSTQGKGVGSRLMRHMLAEIGHSDCYLETGTRVNLGFYERFGFEIVEPAAQLAPGNGPTHWTMLRPGQ